MEMQRNRAAEHKGQRNSRASPLQARAVKGCQWQACSCPCCQQMPVCLTALIAVTKRHQDIVSFAPSLCKRQQGGPCPHFTGKKMWAQKMPCPGSES